MSFKEYTISLETVLGENEDHDASFFNYLDQYSISHSILETEGQFPVVSYTGGPVSLCNMLRDRFGMEDPDILQQFPEIYAEK